MMHCNAYANERNHASSIRQLKTNYFRMKSITFLLLFFTSLLSFGKERIIVVSQKGDGNFTTIQQAFDAVASGSSSYTRIKVKPGIYSEKVVLGQDKQRIIVEGEDATKTTITWGDHTGKVVNGDTINTYSSWSASIRANEVVFSDITFENSAGPVGQAVACEVLGDKVVFKGCRFLGNQDTFFTRGPGRIYLEDCYIEGTTDFIFGTSIAVFERCTIHSKKNSYVTAASTPEGNRYGYIFFRCKLTGNDEATKVYLGRPWRSFAKTIFVSCELGGHILPEGWHNWNKKDAEKTAFYAEYQSTGAGASPSTRAPWTKQLSKNEADELTLANIFGKDGYRKGYDDSWNPSSLLKLIK